MHLHKSIKFTVKQIPISRVAQNSIQVCIKSRDWKWRLTVPSTRSTPESKTIFPCTASTYSI